MLLLMAKSEDTKIPMDARYLDLVAERADKAKAWQAITGAKSVRVLEHRFRAKKAGTLSVATVNAIAREVSRRGFPTPPPMVAVIDDDDYSWIEMGRLVREASEPNFQVLLATLRVSVDELKHRGLKKSQDAIDSALKLVDGPTKKPAKYKGRRGE